MYNIEDELRENGFLKEKKYGFVKNIYDNVLIVPGFDELVQGYFCKKQIPGGYIWCQGEKLGFKSNNKDNIDYLIEIYYDGKFHFGSYVPIYVDDVLNGEVAIDIFAGEYMVRYFDISYWEEGIYDEERRGIFYSCLEKNLNDVDCIEEIPYEDSVKLVNDFILDTKEFVDKILSSEKNKVLKKIKGNT